MKQMNRIPFTTAIDDTDEELKNITIINERELMDEAFEESLLKIQDDCLHICPQRDCEERLFVTQLLSFKRFDFLKFKAFAPLEPETLTQYFAQLPLVEYLVYISSVIGLWMGWSIGHVADGCYWLARIVLSRSDKKRDTKQRKRYAKQRTDVLPIYY